jgi:hypothetical protein
MLINHEVNEVARHCNLTAAAVLRVYHSGGSTRNRERVKMSAMVLGLEPPPEKDDRSELDELDFS